MQYLFRKITIAAEGFPTLSQKHQKLWCLHKKSAPRYFVNCRFSTKPGWFFAQPEKKGTSFRPYFPMNSQYLLIFWFTQQRTTNIFIVTSTAQFYKRTKFVSVVDDDACEVAVSFPKFTFCWLQFCWFLMEIP